MKRYAGIYMLFLTFVSLLTGCSGQTEDMDLTIVADYAVIPADGRSKVTFTVYEGNADVTSQAKIKSAEDDSALAGAYFTTEQAGEYYFYAEYNGIKSENVKVVAESVIESNFVKRVCLMEFTDASCTFCPDASRYVDRNILQKNDKVHLIAFHEKDQWSLPQYQELANKFNVTFTPSAVVDMKTMTSLATGERDQVKTAISNAINKNEQHCGVAISSEVKSASAASVTVKILSEKTTDYYLAVYVVEDGIKGYQMDGTIKYDDYYHSFVARKLLSRSIYGDNVGRILASEEKTLTYDVIVDANWNLANTYIYALAMDENGYVNNMQVCLLNGGSADYEYKN